MQTSFRRIGCSIWSVRWIRSFTVGEQINEEVFQASALQTAVKNGGGWHDTRIISYLLDKGADVHFIQDDKGLRPQEIGCWPVLMYMARAVYVNATKHSFEYYLEEAKDRANEFIAVFQRMLEMGAKPLPPLCLLLISKRL